MDLRFAARLWLLLLLALIALTGSALGHELDGEPVLANPGFEDDHTPITIMYAYKGWDIEGGKVPSLWAGLPSEAHPKVRVVTDPASAHCGSKYITIGAGAGPAEVFAETFYPCAKGKVFLLWLWARGSGKMAMGSLETYADGSTGGGRAEEFELTPKWRRQLVVIRPSQKCLKIRPMLTALPGTQVDMDDLVMVQASESSLPAKLPENTPHLTRVPVAVTDAGKSSRQVMDLIEMAPRARWESTAGDLVFGKDQTLVTMVDYRRNVKCCDGRTYARTLYTPVSTIDYETTIRGRFKIKLPKALKIALCGRATAENHGSSRVAVGYILPEEPYRVNYLGDYEPASGVDFSLDLTSLAGRSVELVLRTKAISNVWVGRIHWARAEVICEGVECKEGVQPTVTGQPRFLIKRITAHPRPWKAERLRLTLMNRPARLTGYTLSYDITDFWGRKLAAAKKVSLPAGVDADEVDIDLRPLLEGKVGWWRIDFALKRGGMLIDTQSISISRLPPRPAELNPILGIQSAPQVFTPDYRDIEIEKIKDLGARYVRSNGHDWLDFRKLAAQGNGEFCLTYVPHNYLSVASEKDWTAEQQQKCYDEMFKVVSARKGIVKVYELGNEHNPFSPVENVARLQRTCYAAAKAADPDCIVNTVGAGGGGPAVVDWFRKLYDLAGDSIDNISLHSYTFREPDLNDFLMRGCDQPVDAYIDILKAHGVYPKKKVWITEYGWIADSPVAARDQAKFTVRQFLLGARHDIPMIHFILTDTGYDFAFGVCSEGLTYFNHEPKPSYVAFAMLARRLGGATFVEEKDIGKNRYCYVFEKSGSRFVYIWKATGAEEVLHLPASGGSVVLTDIMGGLRAVKANGKAVAVPLSTYPYCVEGLAL